MKNRIRIIYFLTAIIFLITATVSYSQNLNEIKDENYKFKITFPSGWDKRKVEETTKSDAISYSFDKKDGRISAMILAFKVNEVKNLTDLIYTLEKDLTLNIPKREGDYTEFDMGNYDGRSAKYKDTEFTEMIYYYRTKITDGENFTYVLRFIIPSNYFNSKTEEEIKSISGSFSPASGS